MIYKFFTTIILILFFRGILDEKLKWREETPIWIQLISYALLTVLQAGAGACIAMCVYGIWFK